MWTNEQMKKFENILAELLNNAGLPDYNLLVRLSETSPTTMARVSIKFNPSDLPNNTSMVQLDVMSLTNFMFRIAVKGVSSIELITSVFSDSVHLDGFIHFKQMMD